MRLMAIPVIAIVIDTVQCCKTPNVLKVISDNVIKVRKTNLEFRAKTSKLTVGLGLPCIIKQVRMLRMMRMLTMIVMMMKKLTVGLGLPCIKQVRC